jgi:hypothetical protein
MFTENRGVGLLLLTRHPVTNGSDRVGSDPSGRIGSSLRLVASVPGACPDPVRALKSTFGNLHPARHEAERGRIARRRRSPSSTHYSPPTTRSLPPTFLLRAAATVVGFTTGNVEERSEPSRSPRSSSFSFRIGRPPQHARRPQRSLGCAWANQNRLVLPGKNVDGQFQSSRLPLSFAP